MIQTNGGPRHVIQPNGGTGHVIQVNGGPAYVIQANGGPKENMTLFSGTLQMIPVVQASSQREVLSSSPLSLDTPDSEQPGETGSIKSEPDSDPGAGSDSGSSSGGRAHLKCPTCGRVCSDPAHLTNHKLVHSPHTNVKTEKKKTLKCPICEKLFGRSSHLKDHINRVHEGNKRVYPNAVCKECGRVFARKCSLNLHITAAHNGRGGMNM